MLTFPNQPVGQILDRLSPTYTKPSAMTHPLFTKHEDTLQKALAAVETRGYWSPFAEMPSPKVYGETANADGEAAFKSHLNRTFELDQPSTAETVGSEKS